MMEDITRHKKVKTNTLKTRFNTSLANHCSMLTFAKEQKIELDIGMNIVS